MATTLMRATTYLAQIPCLARSMASQLCISHSRCNSHVRVYDPRDDDSDSEDERFVKALSWSEPVRDLASRQGGSIPCGSVHLTLGEATGEPEPVKLRIMLDSGASIHLFQSDAMGGATTQLHSSEPLGNINGVGGRVSVTAMLGAQLNLKGESVLC